MSEWKKVKIGDIFAIEKGSLQSSKNTPGKYDFITAASEWKTHNSYDHDCEAIVYAVAASGSLGRAHYVNGKFIASDLCFILTEKNKDKYPVNFLFYQIIFEMLRDEIVSKTKTGTSKESINRGNFSNYEIPYFPIDFQLANYQRFVDAKNTIKTLIDEYEKQKSYAKQLRQNILQEAIEGKLTTDWRKQHPVQKGNPDYDAEALFDKIQAEKSETKNFKKTPAPITKDEIPFEIPTNWKWVRLGEIINLLSGRDFEPTEYNDKQEGIPYITGASNIGENGIIINRWTKTPKCIAKYGDLLLVCKGSGYGTLAYADFEQAHIARQIMSINSFSNYISLKYIEFILRANFLYLKTQGKGLIPGIDRDTVLNIFVGLPPLAEQKEIVARVEQHLQTITQLETQIATRETTTKQLMQSILKDAFEER